MQRSLTGRGAFAASHLVPLASPSLFFAQRALSGLAVTQRHVSSDKLRPRQLTELNQKPERALAHSSRPLSPGIDEQFNDQRESKSIYAGRPARRRRLRR